MALASAEPALGLIDFEGPLRVIRRSENTTRIIFVNTLLLRLGRFINPFVGCSVSLVSGPKWLTSQGPQIPPLKPKSEKPIGWASLLWHPA